MRVTVLGHRGMLGHVVARRLREDGYEVAVVEGRFSSREPEEFAGVIRRTNPDWCVNCAAVNPGRGKSGGQMFEVNARLPAACVELLGSGVRFLHASTDGIFGPERSARNASETPDASDDYGLSKIAAERAVLERGGMVIRCSIIGPDLNSGRGLLQWLVTRTEPVQGYRNHQWNGITTLEWARLARRIIAGESTMQEGIWQPGCLPAVSKYELLRLIAAEWKLPVVIDPADAPSPVARTLVPNVSTPDLATQLEELHEWYYR